MQLSFGGKGNKFYAKETPYLVWRCHLTK